MWNSCRWPSIPPARHRGVTGYYAIDSRLAALTTSSISSRKMHEAGIGVIMDWVPAYLEGRVRPWQI